MCGIVGYIGGKKAAPILLQALSKLEYRGYDSAGIAVRDQNNNINITKERGRLSKLYDLTNNGENCEGTIGIGHTRWATHGEPTTDNAHPHVSDDCEVVCVHNGIIENYVELKNKLEHRGYTFYSETDTEVAVKLVDYYFNKFNKNPIDAIRAAMLRIRGSYALGIMFKNFRDTIYVAKKDSPVVISKDLDSSYVASDPLALLAYSKEFYYLENYEIAELGKGKVRFFNLEAEEISKEVTTVDYDDSDTSKGKFEHYMIKEIYEQPSVYMTNLNHYLVDGKINKEKFPLSAEEIKNVKKIDIVACGSAYHVGVLGKYIIEDLARIHVNVDIASEYRYRNPIIDSDTLVIIISQSGETADSLAALRKAKEMGAKILAITNVQGSNIEREADYNMSTHAGREIAVATTKAYLCQLLNMFIFALELAHGQDKIDEETYLNSLNVLRATPHYIQKVIDDYQNIASLANEFINTKDIFFIGRGLDYGLSMEGSLKLKEISYIHSEAYAAGELKHGTISLIEESTLVIGILSQDELYEKTLSNMLETKARGAKLLSVSTIQNDSNESDVQYFVPSDSRFKAAGIFPTVCFLQLFAYYIAVNKGLDVDKPRNLAKSVTVE